MIELLAILLVVFLILWLLCQIAPVPGWLHVFSLGGWLVVATAMLLGFGITVG